MIFDIFFQFAAPLSVIIHSLQPVVNLAALKNKSVLFTMRNDCLESSLFRRRLFDISWHGGKDRPGGKKRKGGKRGSILSVLMQNFLFEMNWWIRYFKMRNWLKRSQKIQKQKMNTINKLRALLLLPFVFVFITDAIHRGKYFSQATEMIVDLLFLLISLSVFIFVILKTPPKNSKLTYWLLAIAILGPVAIFIYGFYFSK